MTLEEIRDALRKGAHPNLSFSIRHGILWIEVTRGGDDTPVATGTVSLDPPHMRVAGSSMLSGDPQTAESETRVMMRLVKVLRRAEDLLLGADPPPRRRRGKGA